jgi:transposase-like protein
MQNEVVMVQCPGCHRPSQRTVNKELGVSHVFQQLVCRTCGHQWNQQLEYPLHP